MIKIKLNQLLTERDITPHNFSKMAEVRYETIWKMVNADKLEQEENGLSVVSIAALDKICNTLKVPIQAIIEHVPAEDQQ